MANWNLPSITDLYTNVLAYIGNRLNDLALMLDSVSTSPTNLPTGAKRWNSTSKKWEVWDGSAWADMAALYAISISGNAATATNSTQLGGVAASGYATAAQGVKADAAQPASTAINTSNIGSQTVAVAGSCTGNAATATSVTIGPSIQGSSRNLVTSASGTSATINFSADEIVVKNSSHNYVTLRGLSKTANTGAASGVANSLDTGSWAYSTWYYIHLIWDGTNSALLFSLSATNPLLPTGYTHFAKVNSFKTPDSGNYNPKAFTYNGLRAQYKVGAAGSNVLNIPIMASGKAGSVSAPTWQSLSVSAFVPPTAKVIHLLVSGHNTSSSSSSQIMAAPNNNYGACNSTTNPPPVLLTQPANLLMWHSVVYSMLLESTYIYYASNDASAYIIGCIGWEE